VHEFLLTLSAVRNLPAVLLPRQMTFPPLSVVTSSALRFIPSPSLPSNRSQCPTGTYSLYSAGFLFFKRRLDLLKKCSGPKNKRQPEPSAPIRRATPCRPSTTIIEYNTLLEAASPFRNQKKAPRHGAIIDTRTCSVKTYSCSYT
jgi:hypothetical protein